MMSSGGNPDNAQEHQLGQMLDQRLGPVNQFMNQMQNQNQSWE